MASADDLLLIMASLCPNKISLMHKSECSCLSRGLKLQLISHELECSIKCVQQMIICMWSYCCSPEILYCQ